jgi:hypothetical protein
MRTGIHIFFRKKLSSFFEFTLIKLVEQIPSRGGIRGSVSQEILRLVWDQNVHHRDNNSPILHPIMKHMNAVHIFMSHSLAQIRRLIETSSCFLVVI